MGEPSENNQKVTRALLLAGLAVTVAVSALYLVHPRFLAWANLKTTDAIMALGYHPQPTGSVVIVDIDESSLSRYGHWPWSRSRLAHLLKTIKDSGATAIGLDLILTETARTAPKNSLATGAAVPGIHVSGSASHLDEDRALAATLAGGPFVLGYEFLFRPRDPGLTPAELHAPSIVSISRGGAGGAEQFFQAHGVVGNSRILAAAAARSGFLNASPDEDGELRRVPLLIRYQDSLYPSLALAILMQHDKRGQIEILSKSLGRCDIMVGRRSIAVDSRGNMIVRFVHGSDGTVRIPAGELLDGTVPARRLQGKVVVVGSSAAGLEPVYQTPAGAVMSHSDLHAQVIENLIDGRTVVRTRSFVLWEVVSGCLLAGLGIFAIIGLGILPSAAVSVLLSITAWGAAALVFARAGYLFSPLFATSLIIGNYAVLTIVKTWKFQLAAQQTADNTLVLLKSSEKNLNSIIKAVPDIIFRLDKAGRITFISPAVVRYAGSCDHLLGRSIFDLVVPEDLPKARYRLNEKRTGARATRGLELRLSLSPGQDDASPIHFSISAEGLYREEAPSAEQFIGTQGIMRDITQQKKLEESLLQAQKMEAIGRLAAGVAHDLNNILLGLVAYPDLLLLELPPDSPLREKIAPIQKSGQKAAAIVQDLLTMGRRGVKNSESVNLNAVIGEYLESLEWEAAWKQHPSVRLETALASDLLYVKGSKVHLAKAVMNLLNNAAEAMPSGGVVSISTCNRCVEGSLARYETIPPGNYVCVCVCDQGVGISQNDLHRIFEPFYTSKSMGRSGSGLGMTVIWATVKDHGGYVDLESREGEGTRIELYLPATWEHEEDALRGCLLDDYLGTEKILVVDDAPEQLDIAASMLGRLGYAVTAVPSGEAAVEFLRSHSVDLVVLDMIMPGGMDGLDSYRKICEIRPGQRAIVTSGFSESERVEALQALGGGAYVQKPYTMKKLAVSVRRELDRGAIPQ